MNVHVSMLDSCQGSIELTSGNSLEYCMQKIKSRRNLYIILRNSGIIPMYVLTLHPRGNSDIECLDLYVRGRYLNR